MIKRVSGFFVLILLLMAGNRLVAQDVSLRRHVLFRGDSIIKLDSLTLYPNSLEVWCGSERLEPGRYEIRERRFLKILSPCGDSIVVTYRVLPIDLDAGFQRRDTSLIYSQLKGERERFLISASSGYQDVFGTGSIRKNGSISRGISFGNNQDLSVSSSLNLELSGELTPNLKLLATVSDDNLPIQAEGNTNKLQEFDQVFIQLYNDKMKLIAGDFWLQKPQGYFLTYRKRAQGLHGEYSWSPSKGKNWFVEGSGALSKGKFARQIIQGLEGNQGPYRLLGNENEPFIIVLSGTEKVFIDGRQLERGQEFDYIINYNTAEVIFTARNLITKDVRIVVEFQYSDQNYARSLFQGATRYESERLSFWLNAYSEQDAKNQTIQQDLTLGQKKLLSEIGDSLHLARTNSTDSVGFLPNQNMYKLIDSLGIDSVLVFSVNPDSAIYRATFTYVGPNQGDYVPGNATALGKTFVWVAPVGGVSQGSYQPARLMISPKQKRMLSSGVKLKVGKQGFIESEMAYSENDLNTFSRKDAKDDVGFGNRTRYSAQIPFAKKDSVFRWSFKPKAEVEMLSAYFSPIELYRAVEFDRDWNTRGKNYQGSQLAAGFTGEFSHQQAGSLGFEQSYFGIGNDYSGLRSRVFAKWRRKGFALDWNSSYLLSEAGSENNRFLRHKGEISQRIGKLRFGFKDDYEQNVFRSSGALRNSSYLFFDHEYFLANVDSSKFNYKLFYRERLDKRPDSIDLLNAARARNAGLDLGIKPNSNQRINLLFNYRQLTISDPALINQTPENTLLGRVELDQKAWKGALSFNSFYEVGSGLELKKEFLYLQVNDGQGIYTWIDYNGDGVKDLNEFEIAQYIDQASYIRVFTPSNEYVNTFSTEFNQGIFIKPERIWADKKGLRKGLSFLSGQTRVRVNRKTNSFQQSDLNPFQSGVRDTTLLSSAANIRQTIYLNRTGSVFGMDYSYQDNISKTLLASGFDARQQRFHEVNYRLNIKRKFSLEGQAQRGFKLVQADYTSGRNYNISYVLIKPSFIYQPSTSFRVSLDSRYQEKRNVDGETAFVGELGTQLKWNQAMKGSLQGAFSMIQIRYSGSQNSALGFEMLEALKPGQNYTWNLSYQRSVSKNLQISIQYNGRHSENSKTIHAGGMEVRAFF